MFAGADMRLKLLICIVLAASLFACSYRIVKTTDKEWREVRLQKRVLEFDLSKNNSDYDKMWSFRSSGFQKLFTKESYLEFLRGRSFESSYYQRDASIILIELNNTRAKVKMKTVTLFEKSSPPITTTSYAFWVFEGDDWYLLESESATSSHAGW